MIPATRWRRAAVAAVVAADLLLLLLAGAALPGIVPFAAPLLALGTAWAVRRPGGLGGLALLAAQVLTVGVARAAPGSVTDWAVAALAATLLLVTHVALALLAAWPPGAALPHPTVARWASQTGVLAGFGTLAALLGVLASGTPMGWGPWLVGLALMGVAGSATQVGLATRRRR